MPVVLQKLSEERWARRLPCLLCLGCHSKEAGDEDDLPHDQGVRQKVALPI
jgi:hypothetical protein